MKKKLMEALKTKFSGVDEAILDRIATKRGDAITDEAEIPSIVEGVSFQDVLTSYGDFRAGDASVKAISNYEKKHNIKDGKTSQPEPPVDPNDPDGGNKKPQSTDIAAIVAEAVKAAVNPLQEKLSAFESGERQKSYVAGLKERLKDVDEKFYSVALGMAKFETDEQVEDFVTKIETEWKSFTEEHAKEGLSFSVPSRSKGEGKDEIDSLVGSIEQGTKDIVEKQK